MIKERQHIIIESLHKKGLLFTKTILLLLYLICFLGASAQQEVSYVLADVIDKTDGLSSNQITSVYRFKNRWLFVGTTNGLNIYDGNSINWNGINIDIDFPLNGNRITSFSVDDDGHIFIGSNNGINKINVFKSSNESFFNQGNQQFPPNNKGKEQYDWVVKTANDQQWMLSKGVLHQVKGKKVEVFWEDKYFQITKPIADKKGNLFFFNNKNLVGISPQNEVLFDINLSEKNGGKTIFGLSPKLFLENDGNIVLAFIASNNFFRVHLSGDLIALSDKDSKITQAIAIVKKYAKNRGMNLPDISSYFEDEQGIQWLGTSFGLVKIIPKVTCFSTFPTEDIVSCRGFYEHTDGQIFGGAYSKHNFYSYHPITGKLNWFDGINNIYDIKQLSGDTLLLVSDGGPTYLFDAKKGTVIEKKLYSEINNNFYDIFIDQSDTIWYGQNEGIYLASVEAPLNISKLAFKPNDPIVKAKQFMHIEQAKDGDFWLASNYGLYKYRKDIGTVDYYNAYQEPRKRLTNSFVRQFEIDNKGNLWIATTNGLNYLDTKKEVITKKYTSKNGLCDNLIYSMILENDTTLWLGTDGGLSQFHIKEEKFVNFYEKDGIRNNEFNTNSYLKAANGKLYFGGVSGVSIIDPKDLPTKKQPIETYVSSYMKYDENSEKLKLHFYPHRKGGPIYLPKNEKYIEFHFANDNFDSSNRSTYSVFLEGYENDWVDIGTRNVIRYSNLEQDNYILHVNSISENGICSEEPLSVPLIVERPLKEQWWYSGLLMFGIMSIFLSFYLFHQNAQNRNNQIRYRIATDLHDDVSNTLNNIQLTARDLALNAAEENKEGLKRIENMSSAAIGAVADVIWSVDREFSRLQNLLMVMEDYLDEVVRSKKIPIVFEKINLNTDKHLNILLRRNLLLIFKEAVSNAAKHTRPTKLTIRLKNIGSKFEMVIHNEYKERIVSQNSGGRGLDNLRRRAKHLNGELIIEDQPDSFLVKLVLKNNI